MDFTLIPICSEKGHTLIIKQNGRKTCDICFRQGVFYQCTDCEESRCKLCHKEFMKLEREKTNKGGGVYSRSRCIRKKKPKELSISQNCQDSKILAQNKLDHDNLNEWRVKFSSSESEIYYYHVVTKSITYDYPKESPPPPSPGKDDNSSETVLTPESPKVRIKSNIGESVCDIYNSMKHRVLHLNLY